MILAGAKDTKRSKFSMHTWKFYDVMYSNVST